MSRRALALLAFIFALAPLSLFALPNETWLVVIGNNDGAGGDVGLLYAERDAREVAEVFRQQGPIASTRIRMLLGERADTVRRSLVELNASLRARPQGSTDTGLIVFYSGHGDANALHLNGTELSLDELKGLVAGSPAGVRLLIVDACRSGSVTRVKGVEAAPTFELGMEDDVATSGLAILTSSGAGETSQESDRLRGSFFTHHFLNALRGAADQDGDGRITLSEAYAYAYAQTLRTSGQTTALQHPTYSWDLKGRGDLVLSQPAQLRGRAGRIRLAEAATYLILEGSAAGNVTAEVAAPAPHRELSLIAGDYFVQERMPSEYREYHVELQPGQTVDLEQVPSRLVQYDHLVRQRGGDKSYVQGLTLLAGARGEIVSGEGVTPQLVAGYSIDFPSFTVGARLRGSTVHSDGPDGLLPRRHDELGLGLEVQRYVDWSELSVGFGLTAESVLHWQHFQSTRDAPARTTLGADFGGLFTVERHLAGGLAVHVEGGPLTSLFNHAVITNGAQTGTTVSTPLTWWLAGGLTWRL